MNDYEKGWVEALIDSEGSFCITPIYRKYKDRTYVSANIILEITNTDKQFLEKGASIIGGTILDEHPHVRYLHDGRTIFGYKPVFILKLYPSALRKFLDKITLVVKEKHRKIVLEALTFTASRRKKHGGELLRLSKALKQLNGRRVQE